MIDKYYLIISIALISFIGAWAIFNAGYDKVDNEIIVPEKEENFEKSIIRENPEETNKIEIDNKEKSVEIDKNNEDKENIHNKKATVIETGLDQVVNCEYKIEVASPKALIFNEKDDEFWVTSLMNKKHGVVVFDSNTGERKNEINLNNGGGVEIIFNEEKTKAYVSQMETGKIFEINVKSKEILEKYSTNSSWTKALTLSSDQKFLYASNWIGDNVSKINLETGEVLNIKSVKTPRGIHLTENDKHLYVAGFKNGEIQKINLETGDSSLLIRTGGAMRSIVSSKDYLYVSDMANGSVYRVNKDTDQVVKFVDTDNNPNNLRIYDQERVLIVSNRGINYSEDNYSIPGPEWGTLQFFNLDNGQLMHVLIAGNQPTALDVLKDEKKLAFSNFLDHNVYMCDLPNFETLKNKGEIINYKEKIIKQ